MADQNTAVIQGTLDMLILKTLSLEPLHAYGIARRVERVSACVYKITPGPLLPAVQRRERAGAVGGAWRKGRHPRRARYYRLTRAGHRQLDEATADWRRRAGAVARLLNAEG